MRAESAPPMRAESVVYRRARLFKFIARGEMGSVSSQSGQRIPGLSCAWYRTRTHISVVHVRMRIHYDQNSLAALHLRMSEMCSVYSTTVAHDTTAAADRELECCLRPPSLPEVPAMSIERLADAR